MLGRTIGHYRVLEKIGEGGMGVVYLAEDLRLKRRVALKAVRPDVATDPARRARLKREAQAAAALSHENIASVHELEIDQDGTFVIVLEYVAGTTLRDVLHAGVIPIARILPIAIQIADGLDAAHRAGVVHRDLKPENVIVTDAGRAKLLDFGVAHVLGDPALQSTATRMTEPGALVGTMSYAAPEQLTGHPIDGRTDLFALGLVLFELVAHRPAFRGSTPVATAAEILTAEVPALPATTPSELVRIVRKCLRKNPDERYQSARDVAIDLRNLEHDLGATGQRSASALITPSASGLTPSTWWRVNNVFDVVALTVGIVLLSGLRDLIGGAAGQGWYFTIITVAAAVLSLRAFLIVVSFFDPGALPREVQRTTRWLKPAEALMFGLLLVAAGLLAVSSPGLTGLLLVLTVGGFIVALFVEPLMIRAAFPQLASDTGPAAGSSLVRRASLAGMQLTMTAPWLATWSYAGRLIATDYVTLIKIGEWPTAVAVILGLTVGCWFGLSLTTGMMQGRTAVLQQYLRWFWLHLVFNTFGILFAMVLGLRAFDLLAGLPALALAFIPIYQRRLARKLLEERAAASPV